MYREIADKIGKAGRIVFFTGAGISTESGIPDFRSSGGLYSEGLFDGVRPEKLLSRSFFDSNPGTFYDYYFKKIVHRDAKPNAGHKAMADFEKYGFDVTVVTQNIDGLHEKAGSTAVLELHGTVMANKCMSCGAEYSLDDICTSTSRPPSCSSCGGLIKPCVTLYGEALDNDIYMEALDKIANADVLMAVGSSLTVYPATGLLEYFNGDVFAIVNRTPTPFDKRADHVFRENAGTVLPRIIKEIRK